MKSLSPESPGSNPCSAPPPFAYGDSNAANLVLREKELSEVEDLRRLHENSVRLIGTRGLSALLDEVLRAAMEVNRTDRGLLSLFDKDIQALKVITSVGLSPQFLEKIQYVPLGAGACGTCSKERKRTVVEDTETDPVFAQYRDAAKVEGFRAVHSTPLITRNGDLLGVLSVHFPQPHSPTAREMRLMDLYARQAADAIEGVNLRDATQRMEVALRDKDIQVQAVADLSPVMLARCSSDFRFVFVNRAYADRFSRTPQQIIGRKIAEIIGDAAFDSFRHHAEAALAGRSVEFETEIPYRDLGIRFMHVAYRPDFDSGGNVVGWFAAVHDLTEWKRAERELRASEEFNRAIIESSKDCIKTLTLDGKILSINRQGAEALGVRDLDQVVGTDWIKCWTGHDLDAARVAVSRARSGGTGQFTGLFPVAGRARWWNVVVTPIPGGDGKTERLLAVSRDVTDQKSNEEELERIVAERTGELREIVTELEAFSYSIAHDMRAPLRAMQSFSHLLNEEFSELVSETGKDYLRRIMTSANRMDRLIQDVLNYSRVTRSEMTTGLVNLDVLLQGILESYPQLQQPGISVTICRPLPQVIGNEASLTQCFSNLLGNAVKFVKPGISPTIVVRAERHDKMVRIWIEDNGIGIAPEHKDRIFGIFQRLNKEYPGTGIGLPIVKKAVERMGGEIGLESELGRGSRFWFELPAAD